MKTVTTLLLLLSVFMSFGQVNSSTNDNEVQYRIVAHKEVDNGIVSVSNVVQVTKRLHIQVPNAFSPDGDGVNDVFMVVHDGIENFNMEIYNRWGELVYFTDDTDQPWRGMYNGSECQQDAYVYVITASGLADDTPTVLKGTVSLIR